MSLDCDSEELFASADDCGSDLGTVVFVVIDRTCNQMGASKEGLLQVISKT